MNYSLITRKLRYLLLQRMLEYDEIEVMVNFKPGD